MLKGLLDLVHASERVPEERSTFLPVQAKVMMEAEQPDENENDEKRGVFEEQQSIGNKKTWLAGKVIGNLS